MLLYNKLTANKALELVISKCYRDWYIFNLDISLALKGHDHAGFNFYFALLGYKIEFNIYDVRHWNYDKNRWYKPGEEQDV